MEAAIQWFLSLEDLPEWLQASAALVALILSVWAILLTGAQERRRDRLQAQAMAIAIYPELLKLKESVSHTRTALEHIREASGHLVGQSVAGNLLYHALPMPNMLARNVDQLFMLGRLSGPACLQLVSVIEQYNDAVPRISSAMVYKPANEWGDGIENLIENLNLIDSVADKCETLVRPAYKVLANR